MTRLVVFYDDACRFCTGSVAWALRRDHRHALSAVGSRSDEARRLLGARWTPEPGEIRTLPLGPSDVPTAGGTILGGADAVAAMLLRLPRWAWAGHMMSWRPARPVAATVYRWIARNRRRIAPSCPVPAPAGASDARGMTVRASDPTTLPPDDPSR